MTDHLKTNYIIEDKITIRKIPAILFRPKEGKKLLPTIILYHGWSSNKELQRMRGFILSAVGYQVIIPDAIYHGERNPLRNYDIDDATKYFWKTILNNIEESHIIIEDAISKYGADSNKIGVIGNSMGGFTAAGAFTHNPIIKALVAFNGSCGWRNFNKRFKEFNEISITGQLEKIEGKVNKLDPQNNLNLLMDRPILLLHGDSDNVVPIESQRIFYNKIKPMYKYKDKIKFIEYPNLNHFVTTNMMEESIAWFYKYL
ncbi:alpha/beta hydrolase family protein [Schnuerera sp.]|uniref:alpha/beta hydrolase family protein n=1 Tax=Schnuerera sp. TaxID=2794844 RepID=UPI002CA4B2FE|nr:prolyl oligopeptidase family serine peptidase [Schnuerera sp.]HSH35096.1 prolyl oligopeptidase family serine peptidase [Schnuerera sp.]